MALSPSRRCDALSRLDAEGPSDAGRFRIRLMLLRTFMAFEGVDCPADGAMLDRLQRALDWAYTEEDDLLIASVNRALAMYHTERAETGPAIVHAQIAAECIDRMGHDAFAGVPHLFFMLGYNLYQAKNFEQSIRDAYRAIRHPGNVQEGRSDTLNTENKMFAWNTIGLSYGKLNQYDSAFFALDNALALAGILQDEYWQGLIEGNRGDVFFRQGRYDSAEVLLRLDVTRSLAAGQYANAANSQQWIARIRSMQGESAHALGMLREAEAWLNRMPDREFRSNLFQAYAQVFRSLGQADSTFIYMDRYHACQSGIDRDAADGKAEIVRLRMDNLSSVTKIVSLNKEKRRISLIRNFSIAFVLLVAATGMLYLNRQRLRHRLQEQKAREEKRVAVADAMAARQQLAIFTEGLTEKTQLIETLQARLSERALTEDQAESIRALSRHSILTDEDWDRFRELFDRVYPGFFARLRQEVSDITLAEMRMAALSKLQVQARTAANMLGISPNSVHKTRQRLRQRLGLSSDADLEDHFSGYGS